MNVRRITTASQTILAAQKRGVTLATPLAMALEAELLLQSPGAAAELTARRNDDLTIRGLLSPSDGPSRVPMPLSTELAPAVSWLLDRITELEKDTPAAGAAFTPAAVLIAVARALREQPTGAQLLEGLDELGELSVCDGEPAEIAWWVAALCHLVHLDDVPAAPAVVYRAEHDAIVAGLYTTIEAAQQHCEALVSREYPEAVAVFFEWCVDEDGDALSVAELDVRVDGEHVATGYTVTPLGVAAEFDPDADE